VKPMAPGRLTYVLRKGMISAPLLGAVTTSTYAVRRHSSVWRAKISGSSGGGGGSGGGAAHVLGVACQGTAAVVLAVVLRTAAKDGS